MQLYQGKNDSPKVIEYGEKVLRTDPNNLVALLTLARALSLDGKQASIERAIQYGTKAEAEIAKLKTGPPQQGYTDDQWKQYIESNEGLAKNYLSYARAMKR